ncbi:MAG TPA: hypothetical protein VFG50_01735 [Rhodothermales bacterium]|nr:hypothetical protein [Rhodothermales bacterium]
MEAQHTTTPEDQQTLWDHKRKESMDLILGNLAEGNSRARSCDYSQVSRQTFYDWLKQDKDFAWRVELAELEAASHAEAVLFRCAMKAEEDPRFQRSLQLYLDRQDKRRERLLAAQEERRRQEQQAEEAKAEEQRRREEKARRAREREQRREEAVRARDREFRRKHPELGDPDAEPTEEELDVWRRWFEHEEARQKQYRRMVRLNRQSQQR